MTLGENKKIMLSLIEEYSPQNELLTDDADIQERINHIYNTAYHELAQLKKIKKVFEINKTISKEDFYREYSLPADLYQINNVLAFDRVSNRPTTAEYYIVNDKIYINDTSDAIYKITYYAYPIPITEDTPDDFELEIDADAQQLLPYAVASDILKTDVSADYSAFEKIYMAKRDRLDTRSSMPTINMEIKYNV